MAKIIITNDDGIEAPGIEALYKASADFGERVVVAPDSPQSGAGHAVTTKSPIGLAALKQTWYSVKGTPADCARVALRHIAPDADWLFSGVNRGGNLGADTYISGTVAAAREAVFLGCRAMAFSQYVRPDLEVDWNWTARQVLSVLTRLLDQKLPPSAFWNINLPHLPAGSPDPEIVFCKLDLSPLHVRFRLEGFTETSAGFAHFDGNYHERERQEGRDVEVCFGGRIAVTQIPLDITP